MKKTTNSTAPRAPKAPRAPRKGTKTQEQQAPAPEQEAAPEAPEAPEQQAPAPEAPATTEAEKAAEAERSRQSRALAAARVRYETGLSASGRATQHNGDPVAQALRSLFPAQAVSLAERVCGLEPGSLAALYAERNPGSQRMNAGNRVRGWLRKETREGRGEAALQRLQQEAGH